MKRAVWITVVAVVAFAAIVAVRMPVSTVAPAALSQQCSALDGTLWSGTCQGVIWNGRQLGDLSWELHPLRLLLGQLSAHVRLADGPATGNTDLLLALGGHLTLSNLNADAPLDPQLLPEVPRNITGRVHTQISLAQLEHNILTRLEGRIEIHGLIDRTGGNDTSLGSFAVTFPPGASGDPTGRIRDLDGPLAVEGTVKLTRQPGFEIAGFIAPRKGASPEVVNNIAFLGSPDASGRREFSLAGTF